MVSTAILYIHCASSVVAVQYKKGALADNDVASRSPAIGNSSAPGYTLDGC